MATATAALASVATEASSATTMAVMRVNVLKICLYESVHLREVHAAVSDGQLNVAVACTTAANGKTGIA